jgi:hypothetical protein
LRAACATNFAGIKMLLAWEEGAAPRRLVGIWAPAGAEDRAAMACGA